MRYHLNYLMQNEYKVSLHIVPIVLLIISLEGNSSQLGNLSLYPKSMALFHCLAHISVLIVVQYSFDAVYIVPVLQSYSGNRC